MLLSRYTCYQGDRYQSKYFRDHGPQIKMQHQMKCHQLQTGPLIQEAGSTSVRLGGGSAGQFILIRQSRQASCVARAVGGWGAGHLTACLVAEISGLICVRH